MPSQNPLEAVDVLAIHHIQPMKRKSRDPFIPVEKHDTVRHELMALLLRRELSARELSVEMGVSEKEVFDHLEHLRIMLRRSAAHLKVTPACCRKCGFVFEKRDRLTKPGKCPVCRGTHIEEPRFTVV
jgi:predicted Zn-ribbon and HTH transcriptional regulator